MPLITLPKCEVCKSSVSQIKNPDRILCQDCLNNCRLPYESLVGNLIGCIGVEELEFKYDKKIWEPIIKATLRFYKKTRRKLWKDIYKLEKEYGNFMLKEI